MSSLQVIGITVLVVIATVALCIYLSFPVYKERYRLTVDVEAGGQIHSGSTVIQVRWLLYPKFIQGIFAFQGGESRVHGQAVFIDLGSRGALLVALRPSWLAHSPAVGADFIAIRAFYPKPLPRTTYITPDLVRAVPYAGRATLTNDNLPEFIWLRDVSDPNSARPVLPNDFSTVIGPEVRLVSAQIEMTSEPLSTGLERRLPWLASLREQQLKRGITGQYGVFQLDTFALVGDV